MSIGARVCDGLYWLALTLWVGVLVAAAVAATATFSILPDLGVTLAGFAAYPVAEHGRLAAGHVMEPVFTFVDLVQFAAASTVLVTAGIQWFRGCRLRRPANVVRLGAIMIATGLLVARSVALTPGMNADLRAYWSAAAAGDVEEAQTLRAEFDAAHPTASRLLSGTLLLLVVAVAVSPAALAVLAPPSPADRLPTPALARSR